MISKISTPSNLSSSKAFGTLNGKIKKIKMADNFILATAQIFGLDIVTRNIKDFSSFTDKLLNPFE